MFEKEQAEASAYQTRGFNMIALLTLYPSMTPFLCARGTADHLNRICVELTASAVTFAGDPDGTRVRKQTHKLVLLYQPLIVYKSLHPSISLPLNKKASE